MFFEQIMHHYLRSVTFLEHCIIYESKREDELDVNKIPEEIDDDEDVDVPKITNFGSSNDDDHHAQRIMSIMTRFLE